MADSTEFSGLRAIVWPIRKDELKKFLPMAFMLFCILFNYSLLRINKDALIINAAGGAGIISALKLWVVLPSAVAFMLLYTKLANILSRPKLFYSITLFMLGFFALFGFVLYPLGDVIYLNVDGLIAQFPALKWTLKILMYWPLSLFYMMSELWGTVMLSLLFWQFANQITPVLQAKRFYAMFGFIGNTGLIATKFVCDYVSTLDKVSANYVVIASILVLGSCVIGFYTFMQKEVLTDPKHYTPGEVSAGGKKNKVKLSVGESLKYVFKSKYIGFVALLVICYGIGINLVEGVWKDQANNLYPDVNQYRTFMGNVISGTGLITIVCMLIGTNILRVFGWFVGAITTPLIVLITGVLFFLFIIFRESFAPMAALMGVEVITLAVYMGSAQNVLAKSVKYSLFDATKEMSYIPLDEELKVKGKAAVDIIGGRLGKSGGAVIQWALLLIPGTSLTSLSPALGIVFTIIVLIWIWAVVGLRKEFNAKTGGIADK